VNFSVNTKGAPRENFPDIRVSDKVNRRMGFSASNQAPALSGKCKELGAKLKSRGLDLVPRSLVFNNCRFVIVTRGKKLCGGVFSQLFLLLGLSFERRRFLPLVVISARWEKAGEQDQNNRGFFEMFSLCRPFIF